jgi:hypothetical protein
VNGCTKTKKGRRSGTGVELANIGDKDDDGNDDDNDDDEVDNDPFIQG